MTSAPFVVERFEEIDSTNTYLIDRARHGAPHGLVAVADHQRAGRGRLGRRWEAPPGAALLMSVLLRASLPPDQLHLATAAVALAAASAIERSAGRAPGLKWPNDLVFDDAKVAGILAEADQGAPGGPNGSTAIVVGIGVNLTWPGPPGVGGTSIEAATGLALTRDALLEELLDALAPRVGLLDHEDGRAQLVGELGDRLVTIGREVRVELSTGEIVGRATSLTEEGHLVVTGADGPIEVVAGDIVHLRDATEPEQADE